MHVFIESCEAQAVLPLTLHSWKLNTPAHTMSSHEWLMLPVGTQLYCPQKQAHLFTVVGRSIIPTAQGYAHCCPLIMSHNSLTNQELYLEKQRQGWSLAWITLSDKGFIGDRVDTSGPAIEKLMHETLPLNHVQGFVLPDEGNALRALLTELALGQGYDIICTTGGTGLGPRDVTPEATLAVIDKRLPGFEQCMMQASLSKTPNGAISRAVAGTIGNSICINLPGSHKAVTENLSAILPALAHALEKLHGDTSDCAANTYIKESI